MKLLILLGINNLLAWLVVMVPRWCRRYSNHYGMEGQYILVIPLLSMLLTAAIYVTHMDNMMLWVAAMLAIVYKLDLMLFELTDDLSDQMSAHIFQILICATWVIGLWSGIATYLKTT